VVALLEIAGLTKSFSGLLAVNELSFALEPGEILGLIGLNGSGKTTTLNLIAGTLRADRGSIRLSGTDITRLANHQRVHKRINRTFQLVRVLPGMTVLENVMAGALFGADPSGFAAARGEAQRLLRLLELTDKAAQSADQLTYIDQKRIELARALATRPRVLLLDEWLSGLNPGEMSQAIAQVRSIASEGIGIVLVEHVMDAVRALCTRAVVMTAGACIAAGRTEDVLRDPAVVRAYLGVEDA